MISYYLITTTNYSILAVVILLETVLFDQSQSEFKIVTLFVRDFCCDTI